MRPHFGRLGDILKVAHGNNTCLMEYQMAFCGWRYCPGFVKSLLTIQTGRFNTRRTKKDPKPEFSSYRPQCFCCAYDSTLTLQLFKSVHYYIHVYCHILVIKDKPQISAKEYNNLKAELRKCKIAMEVSWYMYISLLIASRRV